MRTDLTQAYWHGVESQLDMESCVLSGNRASRGGAIANENAVVRLANCTFRANLADDLGCPESSDLCTRGGAIFTVVSQTRAEGAIELEYRIGGLHSSGCVFDGNVAVSGQGWAIYSEGRAITVVESSFAIGDIGEIPGIISEEDFLAASLINPSAYAVDYGVCDPGTSPGASGMAVSASGGDFHGCPLKCPAGFYGRGGPTTDLRQLSSDDTTGEQWLRLISGCQPCRPGSVCPSTALAQPIECQPGYYNPDSRASTTSSCRPCSRGSFQTRFGATACTSCPAGTFSAETGSTACQACKAGGFCEEVGGDSPSVWQQCPGGSWSNSTGLRSAAQCIAVEWGEYAPAGSVEPKQCPKSGFVCPGAANDAYNAQPGSEPIPVESGFAVQPGTGSILGCGAGHWCSGGIQIACGEGTYNNATHRIHLGACLPCPSFSSSPRASTSETACLCERGYFDSLPDSDRVQCEPCLVGSVCEVGGLTLSTLPLKRGYWRTNNRSENLLRCPDALSNESACIGGMGKVCKPWTKGPYCRVCNVSDGSRYFEGSESACLPCTGNEEAELAATFAAMVVSLLLLIVLVRICTTGCLASVSMRLLRIYLHFNLRVKFKQLISLYQIASQVPRVFKVSLPASAARFYKRLDLVSLNPDVLGLPLECAGVASFKTRLYFLVLSPVVISAAITLCSVASMHMVRKVRNLGFRAKLRAGLLDALWRNIVVSFLAFPIVSSFAIQAFSCEEFDDGSSRLRVDYAVDCNDPDAYDPVKRIALAGIIVYPIGVPVMYFLLLHSARHAIITQHPSELSRSLSILHQNLEPRFYWWELAEIFKKLFIVGFSALIRPGESIQLIIGATFTFSFMLLGAACKPFVLDEDDTFATMCNFLLTAILFMCFVLKQAVLVEEVEAYLSEETRSIYLFDSGIASAALIGAAVLALLVTLYVTMWQLTVAARKPDIRLLATDNRPVLQMVGQCRWHLFLSHIWGSGQDQNATIKRSLSLLLPAVSIFLDVDDLQSIDMLETYIEQSQVVQFFCSKGYPSPLSPARCSEQRSPLTHARAPCSCAQVLSQPQLPAGGANLTEDGQTHHAHGRPRQRGRAVRDDPG